ncbi:MAG: hypothetical protein ABSA05_05565 [Opitutaceae bacterium]
MQPEESFTVLSFRIRRRANRLAFLIAAAAVLAPAAGAEEGTAILPLSEIRAGMRGEWRTVVTGTRIDSFPLEVVGVAENFIGPQRAVIICRALDALNQLTGPVAGMSGSPVYIEGRLVGAYAYGFSWPKDQAIIGVTPIEQMLEVGTRYPPAAVPAGTGGLAGPDPRWMTPRPGGPASLPPLDALRSAMKPLPTPLFVSGVSKRVLERFRPQLEGLGLDWMQAPSGTAAPHSFDGDLKPGSPVAGVLMSGDFDFAGTGTVTWRSGNRILAFGHPFLQSGPTDMPMAPAEIITIVQALDESFKLSNTGPVIGTIYQDRLTAIAGEIGRKASTTHFEAQLEAPGGIQRRFQGEMFQNQSVTPLMAAISLLESIDSTVETEREQTLYLDTTMEIAGHEPVKLADAASGDGGDVELALRELESYGSLLENPCEFPNVKSLAFHVRLEGGWKSTRLDSLSIDRDEVEPGSAIRAVIGLRNYRGEPSTIVVSVPVPAGLRASEVELFVGDADAARRMDEPPVPPRTLEQVLDRMRRARSHQDICVKLLERAPGLALEGKNLPDLPPSIVAQLESPNASVREAPLGVITLWETSLSAEGTFSGQTTLPVRIK